MKRKIILTWFSLLFVGVLLTACGRKTAPIPPQATIPAPVSDLAYQLDEKGVTLSWSPVTQTEQGRRLPTIDKFLLERAVYGINDFCAGCPVDYNEVVVVANAGYPVQGQKNITYREERLRPGYIYFYRVRSKVGWRMVSRPSEPVSFSWQRPMAAPTALRVEVGDRLVSLSWQAPIATLDGKIIAEPIYYQVYRSGVSGDFMPVGNGVTKLAFIDRQVKNGESYKYKVRAARVSGGSGLFSDQLEGVPRDLTPPPPPRGLSGIDTPSGIRLFWEPVVADDLGGYLVLRKSADMDAGTAHQVVGRVTAAVTSFIDKNLGDQTTYSYAIRSFDLAVPANESPMSAEIKMKRNR